MKKLIIALLISAVALAGLACGTTEPAASAVASEPTEPTRAFPRLTPEPTRGPTFASKLLMMPTRDFSDVPLTRDEEMRCAVLERDWNELSEHVSSFGVSPSEVFRYEHDIDAYLEACRARGYSLTPWDIPQ